jgi:hypothetical protein
MTSLFGNDMGRSGGPPAKTLFPRKPQFGGPPLLPINPLLLNRVIPNSDNHAFTGYDLILHRSAEEGSPYRVQEHFNMAFRSFRLLLKLSINLTFFNLGYALICFSWQLPHRFLQTIHNTPVDQY